MRDRCAICGTFSVFGHHRCPPKWEVHVPDYHGEDDWSAVFAHDAEEAAERYAEKYDSEGDYTVVGGSSLTVYVRAADDPDAKVIKYEVSGEAVPRYSAYEVKP